MSRILILGSNGLLGQAMQKQFMANHEVSATSIEEDSFLPHKNIPYYSVDLTDRGQVRNLVIKSDPEIIINTAAYTNVDGCEENRVDCWAINVHAVENMLEAPYFQRPIFVQISTDYVFDGEKGQYKEIDKPNPRGNYARSKMAAENIVQASGFEYLILRTQVLYGTGSKVRPNFVTWLLDNLKAGKKVQVVWDQIGSPTYASDVAEAAERLLQAQAYGLFHVSSPDTMSRFDFAQKIAEVFKLDSALIEKIKTTDLSQKSPRPQNSSFNLDKIYNNINWQPSSVEQALEQLKSEMAKKHD